MAHRLFEDEPLAQLIPTSHPIWFVKPQPTHKWIAMTEKQHAINVSARKIKDAKSGTDAQIKSALKLAQENSDALVDAVHELVNNWIVDKDGEPPAEETCTREYIAEQSIQVLASYMKLFNEASGSVGKQSGPQRTKTASSKRGSQRRASRQARP